MTNRRSFLFAALILVVSGCSIAPLDATLRFHVIGQVTEARTGLPVAGLVVGVREGAISADQYHASVVTDQTGNFSLDFSSSRCVPWYLVTARSDPQRISCDLGVKGVVMNIAIAPGR